MESRKQLHILRGLPGSGKSHLARELVGEGKSGAVCSADDYFVNRNGKYNYDRRRIGEAHGFCMGKFIDALASQANPIVVDNTHSQVWEYANYVKLGLLHGYEISVSEISCLDEAQVDIFFDRNVHSVPMESMLAMWRRWEADSRAIVRAPFLPTPMSTTTASGDCVVKLNGRSPPRTGVTAGGADQQQFLPRQVNRSRWDHSSEQRHNDDRRRDDVSAKRHRHEERERSPARRVPSASAAEQDAALQALATVAAVQQLTEQPPVVTEVLT